MKPTTTITLTLALTAAAALILPALSPAEEEGIAPELAIPQQAELQRAAPKAVAEIDKSTLLNLALPEKFVPVPEPPAPLVPKGTKMTEELAGAIAQIRTKLIGPVSSYGNRRALMSRVLVRMDIQYHFAITDTSDSLFEFDIYCIHRRGGWEKIASGVCHPGMESLKVAMPETGIMVDPIKHPLFAAALIEFKRAKEAAS